MVNSIKLILGQLNTIMSYYILPIVYIKNFFFSFGLFLEILITFLSSCIPYIYHIFFFPQVIVHTIYSVQAPFASSSNQNPLLLKFAPQSSSWHLHALIFGLRSAASCVLFCLLSGSLPHFLVYTLNFLGVQKPTLHVKTSLYVFDWIQNSRFFPLTFMRYHSILIYVLLETLKTLSFMVL